MNEEAKKKVDQNWKSQVEKEKEEAQSKDEVYHQPTFEIFLSSLTMQAMIALGKIENPISKKIEKNYDHARFLIDTLEIIKEKTKNNLSSGEEKLLDESLFNLRMMYVDEKKT